MIRNHTGAELADQVARTTATAVANGAVFDWNEPFPKYRRGAPRVGDVVLIDAAGKQLETVVTQVSARRVVTDGYVTDLHSIKTAALGGAPFKRGTPNYLIREQ